MSNDATPSALVVTEDPRPGMRIESYLEDCGFEVERVDDGEKAFNRLDTRTFDALVTVLNGRRISGTRLMTLALERNPEISVNLLVEDTEIEAATEAMRHGAADFQTQPVNLGKLEAVIRRGLARRQLVFEQYALRKRLDERYGLDNLVGDSRQMIKVYTALRQVAPSLTSVLLVGEPGTGKELIAQAIHNNSQRRNEPFVKLDCANMPDALAESELFGQAAGGAEAQTGRIELADGGTLFLDDVDALSHTLQDRLLEFLKRGLLRRAGDSRTFSVDVRIITAGTRPLAELAESGAFNTELSQRLSTCVIEAPALRSRREDIPMLADYFLAQACAKHNRAIDGIAPRALDVLMRYDWPGNVRELRNIIEGMAVAARPGGPLGINDVPDHVRQSAAPESSEIRIATGATMKEIERLAIEETMKVCGYNKESCAKTLGIGLRTLYRKLAEYELR